MKAPPSNGQIGLDEVLSVQAELVTIDHPEVGRSDRGFRYGLIIYLSKHVEFGSGRLYLK